MSCLCLCAYFISQCLKGGCERPPVKMWKQKSCKSVKVFLSQALKAKLLQISRLTPCMVSPPPVCECVCEWINEVMQYVKLFGYHSCAGSAHQPLTTITCATYKMRQNYHRSLIAITVIVIADECSSSTVPFQNTMYKLQVFVTFSKRPSVLCKKMKSSRDLVRIFVWK